jgi:hypothetical protein
VIRSTKERNACSPKWYKECPISLESCESKYVRKYYEYMEDQCYYVNESVLEIQWQHCSSLINLHIIYLAASPSGVSTSTSLVPLVSNIRALSLLSVGLLDAYLSKIVSKLLYVLGCLCLNLLRSLYLLQSTL